MLDFLHRRKKRPVSMSIPVLNYSRSSINLYGEALQSRDCPDAKTARLMQLLGNAVEEWATEYNLENLPRKIILGQAIDAMRAIELALNDPMH